MPLSKEIPIIETEEYYLESDLDYETNDLESEIEEAVLDEAEQNPQKNKIGKNKNNQAKESPNKSLASKISWYPGHIKAAEDELKKKWLPLLDLVIELVDARIPQSGKYPHWPHLCKSKPIITVLTKADLVSSKDFSERADSKQILLIDSRKPHLWRNKLIKQIKDESTKVFDRLSVQGRKRNLRVGVCGLPNVGKSTFLNSFLGIGKKAKTGNKPGVTKHMQWITGKHGFDLLDTPGLMAYSVEMETSIKLGICGLLPEKLFDQSLLVQTLITILQEKYKYKLPVEYAEFADPEIGFVNERKVNLFINQFREGKLGKFCLD